MEPLKLNCNECGNEFEKLICEYNRQVNNGRDKFYCTLSCGVKSQQKERILKSITEYDKNPKLCKHCNNPIKFKYKNENIFCSKSCAAIVNNSTRVLPIREKVYKAVFKLEKSRGRKPLIYVNKSCKHCGKDGIKKTFCSVQCQGKEIQKETNIRIERGEHVGPIQFKRYLSEKRGHKCEMCGLTEWGNKPILLILDHIDGNSINCQLSNLRQICSNCDTLTPTYKGRNKGKGRFARKQRYQEGKSF